ncbi:ankyrin repeat domain-containing protein 49 [Trichoplusia ni]|uniref:Ankyrin repeat domain-containing protein 49 n=1 Tax=Trichoplusia ni TaxID=7111 RepID=A0A7E5VSE3_TRINI|nr:ankyrin repeat domain-containing protein 49 [Trichoplusia ni]XP_026731256.1 ankyrin repeat domain-containing protein 49 [Trichoplusia ni]XP_026731257.1 ankyrin repeat domain-containing protein 49 [Trichoplusia ni]
MSDSEDEEKHIKSFAEVHKEIEAFKKNPETSGMFVSGWDDADQDVDIVKNPKANCLDHVLWAAEHGEIDVLKELLSKQPSLVHAQDSDGYTPLHRAAYSNHIDVISYLLSMNANVNMKTQLGWTPLHSACKWNNYMAAARLLAAGADVKVLSDGGQSPLHITASISHCKATLLILFLKDDIVEVASKKNNSDETPEKLALGHGIYAPLFEMVCPEVSYIRSLAFTTNPYVRQKPVSLENK